MDLQVVCLDKHILVGWTHHYEGYCALLSPLLEPHFTACEFFIMEVWRTWILCKANARPCQRDLDMCNYTVLITVKRTLAYRLERATRPRHGFIHCGLFIRTKFGQNEWLLSFELQRLWMDNILSDHIYRMPIRLWTQYLGWCAFCFD